MSKLTIGIFLTLTLLWAAQAAHADALKACGMDIEYSLGKV
jgi:hypothetical protein